jgi:sporulation protein YlmC with PRC-barrel domain
MIRGTTLIGRPVIDVDAGENLGKLVEVVLDPPSQCVAWLTVIPREATITSQRLLFLPAAVVHAVKPKGITVCRAHEPVWEMRQVRELPRLSHLIGRTVRNRSGAVVGVLDDVLLDGENGRILAYSLRAAHFLERLERWLAGESVAQRWDYVRADAPLQIGHTLVTVPDDAVVHLRAQAAPRGDGEAVPAPGLTAAADGLGVDDREIVAVGDERDAEPADGSAGRWAWGHPRPLPPARWGPAPETPRVSAVPTHAAS